MANINKYRTGGSKIPSFSSNKGSNLQNLMMMAAFRQNLQQQNSPNELSNYAQKKEIDNIYDARKALDESMATAPDVLGAFQGIKERGARLPQFKTGFFPQLAGKISMAEKSFSKDPVVGDYNRWVDSNLIPLARKFMEEKGPITESDVSKLEKTLKDSTLPQEQREITLNDFMSKIQQSIRNKMSIAGVTDEEFFGKYGDLAQNVLGQQQSAKPNPIVGAAQSQQANDDPLGLFS